MRNDVIKDLLDWKAKLPSGFGNALEKGFAAQEKIRFIPPHASAGPARQDEDRQFRFGRRFFLSLHPRNESGWTCARP